MAHFGYVRTAPPGQEDSASAPGRDEQVRKLRNLAMMQDVAVAEIFEDNRVSVAIPLPDRPGGAALLARLQPGDRVLVTSPDRLFRSGMEALAVTRDWHRKDIGLIVADVGTEPVNLNAAGRLWFGMLAPVVALERRRERAEPGVASSLRGGRIGSTAPFGFRIQGSGADAVLVEDPDEQAAIRAMWDLRQENSLRKVAEEIRRRFGIEISHEGVRLVLADYERRVMPPKGD